VNLQNYYWYFSRALPPKLCDDIVQYGLNHKEQMAYTGDVKIDNATNKDIKNMQKIRKSDLVWLDDPWIYKEIHPYIHEANRLAGWNFQWDYSEACQFTKYKLNQFYDWHCDSWESPYNNPENQQTHGKIRKISMTCQLTDGSEYTGGELEFDFRQYDPDKRKKNIHAIQCKEIIPKGTIVLFPSFVWHRVKPVLSGTRYSLVVWNCGYPFV
jgi:PKHD-type hydroxylase